MGESPAIRFTPGRSSGLGITMFDTQTTPIIPNNYLCRID